MVDFSKIYISALLLPFCLSLAGLALIRFFAGEGLGHALASVAVSIAFLTGFLIHFGLPALPPAQTFEKLFFLTLVAAGYGLLQDRFPRFPLLSSLIKTAFPVITVFWMVGHTEQYPLTLAEYRDLAVLTILGTGLFFKMEKDWENGLDISRNLLGFALGLLAVSWSFGHVAIWTSAMIIAAALGGYMAAGLYRQVFPFGAAAFYPAYIAVLGSSVDLLAREEAALPALLVLCAVFYSQDITERLPLNMRHGVKGTLMLAAILLVVLALAQFG
ncbi:hypothetical protein [Luteithermobacter gelatinilyticus]|uniref:hypothetical protein n=1 Tax=Luteithermobacter gelatinilyticus TaxID=2582913 RepID=UPI0011060AEC|nr:hypothetical protein [Luteithermobacter gelatinilyticus]